MNAFTSVSALGSISVCRCMKGEMKRPREEMDTKVDSSEPPNGDSETKPVVDATTAAATGKPDRTAKLAEVTDEAKYEEEHVHSVYDAIASHFSATRYKPWPLVKEYVESLPEGSLMCDVGCGNGKNLGLVPGKVIDVGCDRSYNLLELARNRGSQVTRCDGLCLPYRSNTFDSVISIAVVHHFITDDRRRDSIREMLRILKPGGTMLIYVWAVEQAKDRGGTDVLIDWEVHSKFDESNTVHRRYYHLFKKGELEELCLSIGLQKATPGGDSTDSGGEQQTLKIVKSYFDKENWCVVLQKL